MTDPLPLFTPEEERQSRRINGAIMLVAALILLFLWLPIPT